MRNLLIPFGIALLFCHSGVKADSAKPKYGPEAILLSRFNEPVRKVPAPDYWSLIPYYVGQFNESACSVASVAMIVNGMRAGNDLPALTADEKLATQAELLKRVKNAAWRKGAGRRGGRGVTLDQLGPILQEALTAYGIPGATVEIVHADDSSDATKSNLRKALTENEKSARDFIVANFNQKVFTGDAEVGHIAPVGGYDEKTRRVLILDPDREWYEPYWVSEDTFLNGMATRDKSSGRNRGYVWVRRP